MSRSAQPPRAVPAVFVAAACVLAALFLLACPDLFPTDDAYIHVVYGENLARTGRLDFNPGEFAGVGSTSITWVLAIAGLVRAGVPGIVAAKVAAVLSLCLTVGCLSWLLLQWVPRLLPRAPTWVAWLAAAGCGLSGNMLWFGLSGMETLAFLGLGLLALCLYVEGRWVGVALAAGLATLTRLEGGALVVALLAVHFPASREARGGDLRRLALPAAVFVAMVIPWLGFLHATTGHWLPTTFGGKKLAHMAAQSAALQRSGPFSALLSVRPLVFVVLWVLYAVSWVFGLGFGYPPSVRVGESLGGGGIDLWILAVPLIAFVVAPLAVLGARQMGRTMCTLREDAAGRAFLAFALWAVLHNAAYAILFPSLGTTSRYQAINHVFIWLLPVLGAGACRSGRIRAWAGVAMAGLLIVNVGHWYGTYQENLRHMREVRGRAADWYAGSSPAVRVAAFDIGMLRWGSGRPITDLGGLCDAEFLQYQKAHRVGEFLARRGATHVALPSPHSAEREGFFDLAGFLALEGDPSFRLLEVARFEGSYEAWRRGAAPTFNYMPAVVIYRVEWTAGR